MSWCAEFQTISKGSTLRKRLLEIDYGICSHCGSPMFADKDQELRAQGRLVMIEACCSGICGRASCALVQKEIVIK